MMPRAYSPNLRTVQRASVACSALGITGWHMAAGPSVFWRDGAGWHKVPLRDLESRASTVREYQRQHAEHGA